MSSNGRGRPNWEQTDSIAGDGFGEHLRMLRMRHRLSQSKLADRGEFDHSYISRLEKGQRRPSRDAIERLIVAMGLSRDEETQLTIAAGFLPTSDSEALAWAKNSDVLAFLQLLNGPGLAAEQRAEVVRIATRIVRLMQPGNP